MDENSSWRDIVANAEELSIQETGKAEFNCDMYVKTALPNALYFPNTSAKLVFVSILDIKAL